MSDFAAAPGETPSPPQLPPSPPPRDINPFGQPATPEAKDSVGVDLNSSIEPQRPSSPPPPPPPRPSRTESALGSPGPPDFLPPPVPASDVVEASEPSRVTGVVDSAVESTGKRKALESTRAFERKRHSYFGEKYESDSLYWKCFVELIRRSQANNRRAINYATQKLSATHAYAKSLYAIRDSVDGLNPGSTEEMRERERKRKGRKEWPPQQRPLPQSRTSGADGSERPQRPPSALDCLFEMEEYTAMRTIEMCEEAQVSVIDKKLNAMVKRLDDQFADMVGQGTACLRLMHSAEANTGLAFGRFQQVVTASLEREATPSLANTPLKLRGVSESDVWLADMNYRVAVTQQSRVWKGVSAKLGDLFGRMKDIEVERRLAIQGGLTALVQLQDTLWRDLPALHDSVRTTLDRINVDRHLLDQEVRQQMRVGAARLLADRQEDGGNANGGGSNGGGGSTGGAGSGTGTNGGGSAGVDRRNSGTPDFLMDLESPLASPLIARSTMLERKEKLMIASRWVLVLAILTHDSYLLLFDVPKGSGAHKKQLNARTTEAFAELVPKPEVAELAVELGKHKDAKGVDSGGLPVPPSVAVDLSACEVLFKPDGKNDATFEITEIKPTKGIKTVFKEFEQTTFTLRGRSQEAMVDWVCQIKEMGRAGMKAYSDSKEKK